MTPISYFTRRANSCAEKCAQPISDSDRMQTASQWHSKLNTYAERDLDMAFGTWMNRAASEKKWQLPGVSDIRSLLGVTKPQRTTTPFVKPGPMYKAAVTEAIETIQSLLPSVSLDAVGHSKHKYDPKTGVNDTSKCPICKPKTAGPRRKLIEAILADLPAPQESLYTCKCGHMEGWLQVEDGVIPCPDCHPMGIAQ